MGEQDSGGEEKMQSQTRWALYTRSRTIVFPRPSAIRQCQGGTSELFEHYRKLFHCSKEEISRSVQQRAWINDMHDRSIPAMLFFAVPSIENEDNCVGAFEAQDMWETRLAIHL